MDLALATQSLAFAASAVAPTTTLMSAVVPIVERADHPYCSTTKDSEHGEYCICDDHGKYWPQNSKDKCGYKSKPEKTLALSMGPYCIAQQAPDQGINGGYCTCLDEKKYYMASSSRVCPYTNPPPASQTVVDKSAVTAPSTRCDGSHTDPSCWQVLALGDYVNKWWKDNEDYCSDHIYNFTTCWFKKEANQAPITCDRMESDSCRQPIIEDYKGKDAVKRFYISHALWNTHDYFVNFDKALSDAEGTISNSIASVVTKLVPPETPSIDEGLHWFLYAFVFAFSVWAPGNTAANAFYQSVASGAGLTNFGHVGITPESPIIQEVKSWAQAQKDVGTYVRVWRKALSDTLPRVINDVKGWSKFANDALLTGDLPSPSDFSETLTDTVGALALSSIIRSIGFIVTRANGSVADLQLSGKPLQWDTGCYGYSKDGICGGNYYYDGKETFSIVDPHHQTRNMSDIFPELFSGPGRVTTGKLFFDGALDCAKSCGKNGGCRPDNKSMYTHPSCVSNVRICKYDWENIGPFENCPNGDKGQDILTGWDDHDCSQAITHVRSIGVPLSYIGGGIMKFNLIPHLGSPDEYNGTDVPDGWKGVFACIKDYTD